MSSRQLRKLRRQQELDTQEPAEPEISDDEPISTKPRVNIYAGFAALGDDGDDDGDDGDDGDGNEPDINNGGTAAQADDAAPPSTAGKKKSKKKKKKKAAKKEDPEPAMAEPEMDEVDRAIAQLKTDTADSRSAASPASATDGYARELANLLKVNMTHLKVLNEMRNLFGREIIQAASADSDPQANLLQSNSRQGQQHVTLEQFLKGKPGERISDVLLRGNPFVQGKEHWPKASAGGLSMEHVRDLEDGSSEFTFKHDLGYATHEAHFFALVQMHDPMRLVHFLHQNPYHVWSLIQVSKVAKQDQNSALAGELCERALFTFGRVTLSSFRAKLKEGRARLSFRRPENRQFWLAAYNYLKSLIMKGTYRTALEWAKLVLSLAPEDPYGMLNLLPVLAIRARESRWLLDLLGHDMFASIMALHVPNREYIKQTAVLAKLQVKDLDGARLLLEKGVARLPWLYCSLFAALDVDVPKSLWAIQPPNRTDSLYTELYIHLCKDLWNNGEATRLLKDVANSASRPADFETLPEADEATQSVARFVYLDDTPAIMALVPQKLLHVTPNFDFDPIPPPFEENEFSNEAQYLPWRMTTLSGGSDEEGGGLVDGVRDLMMMLGRGNHAGPAAAGDGGSDVEDEDDLRQEERQRELLEQVEAMNELLERGVSAQEESTSPGFLRRLVGMFIDNEPAAGGTGTLAANAGESIPGEWPDDESEGEDGGDDDDDDDDDRTGVDGRPNPRTR